MERHLVRLPRLGGGANRIRQDARGIPLGAGPAALPAPSDPSQGLKCPANAGPRQGPQTKTRVLYISPLKALGVDVERNLRSPLIGITQTAKRLGLPAPLVSVGVRSGDTTTADRRALLSHPPDILITTPESLFLMLTSKARETLSEVDTVIVDEVHAVAGTKRGAHLAVSLERLDALLPKPAQRIGLSATVEPRELVAQFLAGSAPVEIVAPPSHKNWNLSVSVPVEDMSDLQGAAGRLRLRARLPDCSRKRPFGRMWRRRSLILCCRSSPPSCLPTPGASRSGSPPG